MLNIKKIKLYKRVLNVKQVNDKKDIENIYFKKLFENINKNSPSGLKIIMGKTVDGCSTLLNKKLLKPLKV